MSSVKQQRLREILTEDQILSDPKLLKKYNSDWLGLYQSESKMVLLPTSHKQVQSLVKWALQFNVFLVPSGGRTGLSGGAIATNQEVMLSFERMNQIIEFNETEQSLRVQAGVITKDIQDFAKQKGLYFPIYFSAEGSSQIGGNVATNAGGLHVIRYGPLRNWIADLKVVTGEGQNLCLGKQLMKNAAGYNLMPFFVGTEGTLGLITEVTCRLTKAPEPLCLFLFATSDMQKLIQLYNLFKQKITLNAFEMFTANTLSYTKPEHFPLKDLSSYFVLVECDQKDKDQALVLFESGLEKGYVTDGVVAESSTQAQQLWSFRENISEGLSPYSPYKNDISVRISCLPEFLSELEQVLKKQYPSFTTVYFGHIGDGNLHINILKPESMENSLFIQKCEKVNHTLFALVQKYGGCISAEHGVGLLKKPYLSYSCSKEEMMYMKALKKVFDPQGILNPGKVFDIK